MRRDVFDLVLRNYQFPKPLEFNEQLKCFEELRNGNLSVREKLILHNMRLVIYVVLNSFYSSKSSFEDLISIGTIGLMNAIDRYDFTRGTSFSNYAYKGIFMEVSRYLHNNKSPVVKSLEDVCYEYESGEQVLYEELIESNNNVEDCVLHKELKEEINNLLNDLKEQDKEYLKLYFGFYDRCYTATEIGKMYGVTRACVSKKNINNLTKLAKKLKYLDTVDSKVKKLKR